MLQYGAGFVIPLGNEGGIAPQNKCALERLQYSDPDPGSGILDEWLQLTLDLDVDRLGRNSLVYLDRRVSIAMGWLDKSIRSAMEYESAGKPKNSMSANEERTVCVDNPVFWLIGTDLINWLFDTVQEHWSNKLMRKALI